MTRPRLSSTLHALPRSHQPHTSSTSQHNRTFASSTPQHARLLSRPKRPYAFTQLITLSDGSTFTQRTSSPFAVYKSNKDIRNTPLWNPSDARLAAVEDDVAGKLSAFRKRFGRGWDSNMDGPVANAVKVKGVEEVTAVEDGKAKTVKKEVDKIEGTTVVDGVAARVVASVPSDDADGRQGRNDQGRVQSLSSWSDEEEENLMDLIGTFGKNEKEIKGAVIGKGGSKAKKGKK